MSLPSFQKITHDLDIPRCRGIQPNGQYCPCDHDGGEVDGNKVHWGDDRRVTRAGIRNYLALEAWRRSENEARDTGGVHPIHTTLWWVTYSSLRLIPVLAKQARVMLPHGLGDLDRATLRAYLVRVPPSPERTDAMRWLATQRARSGGAQNAEA